MQADTLKQAHRFDEKALYTKGHVADCEAPERSRYCANSAMCVASFLKSTSSSMLFLMSPTMAARDMRDSSGLMNSNTLQKDSEHLRLIISASTQLSGCQYTDTVRESMGTTGAAMLTLFIAGMW